MFRFVPWFYVFLCHTFVLQENTIHFGYTCILKRPTIQFNTGSKLFVFILTFAFIFTCYLSYIYKVFLTLKAVGNTRLIKLFTFVFHWKNDVCNILGYKWSITANKKNKQTKLKGYRKTCRLLRVICFAANLWSAACIVKPTLQIYPGYYQKNRLN